MQGKMPYEVEDMLTIAQRRGAERIHDIAIIGSQIGKHASEGVVDVAKLFESLQEAGVTPSTFELLHDSYSGESEKRGGQNV